jgi:hypothetical protein
MAYQQPANNTFLSEQTSHQQPDSSTFLSEQISTSHQPNEQAVRLEREEKEDGKMVMYFDYKKGEIHLGTCFPRGQCIETYFCEVFVRNGEVAKRDVWSQICNFLAHMEVSSSSDPFFLLVPNAVFYIIFYDLQK